MTGQKTAEFGGWLVFAHFPILPTTNFNGIHGYSFEMAPPVVCDLQITIPHSQLSQLLRNPSQTNSQMSESSFWHCWGGEVWEGGQQRWKRLLLKSPRGNGQAGNGRAAQDTTKEERKELGFVREKTAVLSFQTGEHG